MISFSSRCGALTLVVLTAGLAPLAKAQDQTAEQMVHNAQGRHLAPHDTFYTLGYDSARTDKGVEGFPPGTEVHLVSVNREAHTLTVTDGHANVTLPPDKLTNDLDIANMVRAQDNANQARIAAYQQAEAKAYQEYEKQAAEYTDKDLEKREKALQEAQKQAVAQEQNSANSGGQPINSSYNNGYYNEGGYGYGSPYGYFTNLYSTNVSGGGKGTAPQVTGQAAGRAGGANTGTLSTGGGKK